VSLRNGEHGYGVVTKTLHWLTFAAILGQFLIGYTMETENEAAEAAAERADQAAEQCEATEDTGAAEAEEERCEEQLDRREDTRDDRADALASAWDDLRSGDLFRDGVTRPELHVLLGLVILGLGVLRVLWRVTTPLPPWAPALSGPERTLESLLEKGLILLLFLIPASGLLLVSGEDDWVRLHIAAHIAFFVVVGLHVALVLKHTVIQRDRHLARML
jgi:cytochrome b561